MGLIPNEASLNAGFELIIYELNQNQCYENYYI